MSNQGPSYRHLLGRLFAKSSPDLTSSQDLLELAARRDVDQKVRHAVEDAERRVERVLCGAESLEIAFQPIVNMATGDVQGHEALARFGDGGFPNERFAEAWALGAETGARLEAMAVGLALQAVGHLPGYVSVNISPATLLAPRFWNVMHGCQGELVVVELTEHDQVLDYGPYQGGLTALRKLGVRIAVDDAGAGFAGLQHILAVAPEVIKMDRAIVEKVDSDPATREMLSAILGFARSGGGIVVAEGVETASQQLALTHLGFRYGQGYLFGRPAPIDLGAILAAEAAAHLVT